MWSRLTKRAIGVIRLARQEADQPHSRSLCTEHLILGILDDVDCPATQLLKRFVKSLSELRQEIESCLSSGEVVQCERDADFSEKALQAIAFAALEADHFSHSFIGTEHLLLGLLCVEESCVTKVLIAQGVTLDRTRQTIAEWSQLNEPSPDPEMHYPVRDVKSSSAFERLCQRIAETLNLDASHITPDMTLDDLVIDSLDHIALAMVLDNEYPLALSVEFSRDKLAKVTLYEIACRLDGSEE